MDGSLARVEAANSSLVLSAHGADALTCAASGKVGIGGISPVNKLCVEGGAAIGASYAGSSAAPANSLIVQNRVGIGTDDPQAGLHLVTGLVLKHDNDTSSSTLSTTKIWQSYGGPGVTGTLPDAQTVPGQIYIIKNTHDEYNVTLTTNGGNIDGNASITLSPKECVIVGSGGTNYQTLAHYNGMDF